MSRIFPVFCTLSVLLGSFAFSGCTSDPYAPINQTTPIRQLDNAFDPSGTRYNEHAAPQPYPSGGYNSPSYSRY